MLLQTFYSSRFTVPLSDDEIYLAALRIWDNALKDISNDIIKKALDSLPERYPSWPPTPGEFYELCVSINGSKRFKWKSDVMVLAHEKSSPRHSNVGLNRLIDEGTKVCKMLKEIYPNDGWYSLADKFTELKKICKSYYPKLKQLEVIEKILTFDVPEIKEMLIAEKIR